MPIKKSYANKIPEYIFSKKKTGWSVPITAWIKDSKIIKNKFFETVNKRDGIEEVLSENNYKDDTKRIIITWMLRTWAQNYNMSI